MFNKTLGTSGDVVFYDTLHQFRSSFRGCKARLNHYLDGVPGCGARTEKKITEKFFESIYLISEKMSVETDDQNMVQLVDSLLWDYTHEDL